MTTKNKLLKAPQKLFEISNITDEKLLTKQDVADLLNISVGMINRMMSVNEIPYFKVGRLVRFSKQRVLDKLNTEQPTG